VGVGMGTVPSMRIVLAGASTSGTGGVEATSSSVSGPRAIGAQALLVQ
jgi:hypothetical protein